MRQEVKMRTVPWWLILLQGIALVIIGILFLTNPGSTAIAVVTILGIYWLITGILGIIGIFLNGHNWFWKLLMGIIGIIAGILILQHPLTATAVVGSALVLWLGLLGIMIGIVQIIRGVTGEGWGALILGIISVILGIIILANFWGVTISLPWSLGILSIIGGLVAIWHSFGARRIQHEMEAGTDPMTNQAKATVAATGAKMDTAATKTGSGTGAGTAAVGAATVAAASRATASDDDAVVAPVEAASDAPSEAVSEPYNVPAAVGALTAEDKLALTSWASAKGITQSDVTALMSSPYANLLARGMTPAQRAALARELGVDEKKVLFYLNLADLQRIKGVGVIYAYLLEQSGVDTVRELATRNPANLTTKMTEVNNAMNITKRVAPEGEVANWVAEAKTLPSALEY